jgi:hypothetical protein
VSNAKTKNYYSRSNHERILKPISNHELSRFEVIGSNLVGRGYVDNNDNESDKLKWRGEWEHTRFLTTLTVNYNYNYYSFEQYLKAQKKRNANQILYYARRTTKYWK